MKRILFTTLIFCLLGVHLSAQTYTNRQEFSVLNPNSHEITKFGLTPINQYTGKANVSFPMFSMNLDGKEVPFNLSYDTGGIRVAQEATWVGLGWNLSGIPVITHQINQKSDIGSKENPLRGYCHEPKLPDGTNASENTYFTWINSNQYSGAYGQPDTQPDVFVANLVGSIIKFQLTQKADTGSIQAVILNDSQAIISFSETNHHFTILDEDGYTYVFNHIEYSTSWTQPGSVLGGELEPIQITGAFQDGTEFNTSLESLIPTAWYVDRIISPDGDTLEFKYDYEIDNKPNVVVSHPIFSATAKVTTCGFDRNDGNVNNGWEAGFFDEAVASRTIQEVMVLSEIEHTSTGNKVLFKTASRDDIFPYQFPNQYLDGFNKYFDGFDAVPRKLTEIEVLSSTNKSIKKINFQQSYYNAQMASDPNAKSYLRLKLDGFKVYDQQYAFKYKCSDALPPKHSKSTDFWGFYNGQANVKRTPYIKFNSNVCLLENPEIYNNNPEFAGAIKGSSLEYTLIGALEEVRYPTGGTSTFEYENNLVTLDLTDPALTPDDFNFPYLLDHNIEVGYPKIGATNPNYRIVPVGGLRTKTVINTDEVGNPLLRKSYVYEETKPGGDVVSSGVLMDALLFYTALIEVFENGNVFHSNLVINSGNVFVSNGSAMGSHLGYSRVEEVVENINGNVDIGRTVSYFINKPNESLREDENEPGIKFVVESPPINFEDANGKLLRQEVFDRDGNPKRQVVNNYDFRTQDFALGYKVYYSYQEISFNHQGLRFPAGIKIVTDFYEFSPKKYIALVASDTIVETLEGNEIVNTSFNLYNSRDRISSSTKTTSKVMEVPLGNGTNDVPVTSRVEYYYPYSTEYGVNNTSIVQDLVAKNQINQPVYIRNYYDDSLVGHQLTKFIKSGNTTKPEGIYFDKENVSLSQMEQRVQYERYDANGNLCQYRQTNGIPVSAIWGYNGQNIVAKIENATYAQIENLAAFGTGFVLGNTGLNASQKSALRSQLSEAMVTIYDHDPMVGPIQMEDTRGYETNYEYDGFNRLVAVRDEANNLLEDYQYQYADVQPYPIPSFSECFDQLRLANVKVTNNRTQYFNVEAEVTGGFGTYQYKWYIGTGTSARTAIFPPNPNGTGSGFQHIICCDTKAFYKLEVTDGTQTVSTIFANPNYNHPECSPEACENPF